MKKNKNTSSRRKLSEFLTLVAALAVTLVISLPLIAVFGTALKRTDDVKISQTLLPEWGRWSLENFRGALTQSNFGLTLVNSAVIAVCATVVIVVLCCLAGYALARFKNFYISIFSVLLFIIQMFPGMLLIIPMYAQFAKMGMVNNRFALMLYYVASNLAFNIMLIRSFFEGIPIEVEEAGMMDGCSQWQVFSKVILPLCLPGAATIGIMGFLNCWNEYTFANLLLKKAELRTFTVGLQSFISQTSTNWGYLMAASAMAIIPALFFLVIAQKYLVEGMTAGAVKG